MNYERDGVAPLEVEHKEPDEPFVLVSPRPRMNKYFLWAVGIFLAVFAVWFLRSH